MTHYTSLASTGLANLSAELLKIELSYTFIASVLIGAIIGRLGAQYRMRYEKLHAIAQTR